MTEELKRNRIRFRRGLEEDLPLLDDGEPGMTTDTHRVFVGTGTENIALAQLKDFDVILGFDYRPGFNSTMLADMYPEGKVTRFIYNDDVTWDEGFPSYYGIVETYRPIGVRARQLYYEENSHDIYTRYEMEDGYWSYWERITSASYSE